MQNSDTEVLNRLNTALATIREANAYASKHPTNRLSIIRLITSEVIDKIEYLVKIIDGYTPTSLEDRIRE